MRCPKCGAFMEDGKDTCMMCGTNARTYVPESNPNALFSSSNSSAFGSGNDFRTGGPTGAFNGAMGNNQMPPAYNPNKTFDKFDTSYKNAKYAPLNKEDRDIFDKYNDNKGLINTILVFILFGIIGFAGFLYYNSRTKEAKLEPVIQNLYFVVDDSFSKVNAGNGLSSVSYTKGNSQGIDCSITVKVGTDATNNHVDSFYNEIKELIEPQRDSNNEIMNEADIYTPSTSEAKINGNAWHYFNIFYKGMGSEEPLLLKNRYLTSMYSGAYYDITLLNYSNDATCSAALDNFTKSLKFVET